MRREEIERIGEFAQANSQRGDDMGRLSRDVPALLCRIEELEGERDRLREALEACLLFHDSGSWDMEKQLSWQRLTRQSEATTRALCDTLRAALKEAQGE